ncbi:MAG: VWA domain-containing protein [Gammaproteobacteria bacterium]|nr:VWA domain-containing protein [Gammaproteobacteria bacterium]
MARRRRENSVFTLSFIDVMAGGFGAVVIMYLIINHATETAEEVDNRNLRAESRLLDYQLDTNSESLSYLRDLVGNLSIRIADVNRTIDERVEEIEVKEEEIEEIEQKSLDQSDTLEELIKELEEIEQEVESLARAERAEEGQTTIEIRGEGDRQYLTGLYMGGGHILIALDISSSMLDDTIVNVIRRRNMDVERQLRAPKWQRAIRTVEWLTANIPLQSRFQVALYNNESSFVINEGEWIDASDGETVRSIFVELERVVPHEGTNLKGLFELAASLHPLPDNLFLIADSLPTMDSPTTNRTTITGRERLNLFYQAVRVLPGGFPVNVLMFPLEGDPFAPLSYWNLAHITGGTLLSPSADWP